MKTPSLTADLVCQDNYINSILDSLPLGFLLVDFDGNIQGVNNKVTEYFGISTQDMIGKPIQGLAETLSRSFTEYMTYHEVFGQPLQDREQEFQKDVEVSAPKHRFMQIGSAPVLKGGKPVARLWLVRDVTQEREITELKIQYGGVRSAEELKSKFMTVISHQLRTPLNAIRWNSELLLSDDYEGVPTEAKEVMTQVYTSVVNSIAIVDDMLLAVDIEQRALKLEKSAVDLGDIIQKVVHDFTKAAKLRSVEIRVAELPADLPRLFLDREKIEIALGRVLDNALKYSPENQPVVVRVRAQKDSIAIDIADQGVGIPEKERSRVFDRFYRSKKAIGMNPNASGLGLYISKYIVEAHDGTIDFDSKEGAGTTFTISLPRKSVA